MNDSGTTAGAESPIAPADHPARKLLVLLLVIGVGLGVAAVLRPTGEDPELALSPYLGTSVRVVMRTEPGAAPDDLSWLEPVTLEELGDHHGVRSALFLLEEMAPIGDPGGSAHLWLPLDRIEEVWAGPKRVYRRVGR